LEEGWEEDHREGASGLAHGTTHLYNPSPAFGTSALAALRCELGQTRHGLALNGGDRRQPDATFIFGISRAGSMNNASTLVSNRVQDEKHPYSRGSGAQEVEGYPKPSTTTLKVKPAPSFLSCPPSPQVIQASGKTGTYRRWPCHCQSALLEMSIARFY